MLGSWLEAEYTVPERLWRDGIAGPKAPSPETIIVKREELAKKFLNLVDQTIEQHPQHPSSPSSSSSSSG